MVLPPPQFTSTAESLTMFAGNQVVPGLSRALKRPRPSTATSKAFSTCPSLPPSIPTVADALAAIETTKSGTQEPATAMATLAKRARVDSLAALVSSIAATDTTITSNTTRVNQSSHTSPAPSTPQTLKLLHRALNRMVLKKQNVEDWQGDPAWFDQACQCEIMALDHTKHASIRGIASGFILRLRSLYSRAHAVADQSLSSVDELKSVCGLFAVALNHFRSALSSTHAGPPLPEVTSAWQECFATTNTTSRSPSSTPALPDAYHAPPSAPVVSAFSSHPPQQRLSPLSSLPTTRASTTSSATTRLQPSPASTSTSTIQPTQSAILPPRFQPRLGVPTATSSHSTPTIPPSSVALAPRTSQPIVYGSAPIDRNASPFISSNASVPPPSASPPATSAQFSAPRPSNQRQTLQEADRLKQAFEYGVVRERARQEAQQREQTQQEARLIQARALADEQRKNHERQQQLQEQQRQREQQNQYHSQQHLQEQQPQQQQQQQRMIALHQAQESARLQDHGLRISQGGGMFLPRTEQTAPSTQMILYGNHANSSDSIGYLVGQHDQRQSSTAFGAGPLEPASSSSQVSFATSSSNSGYISSVDRRIATAPPPPRINLSSAVLPERDQQQPFLGVCVVVLYLLYGTEATVTYLNGKLNSSPDLSGRRSRFIQIAQEFKRKPLAHVEAVLIAVEDYVAGLVYRVHTLESELKQLQILDPTRSNGDRQQLALAHRHLLQALRPEITLFETATKTLRLRIHEHPLVSTTSMSHVNNDSDRLAISNLQAQQSQTQPGGGPMRLAHARAALVYTPYSPPQQWFSSLEPFDFGPPQAASSSSLFSSSLSAGSIDYLVSFNANLSPSPPLPIHPPDSRPRSTSATAIPSAPGSRPSSTPVHHSGTRLHASSAPASTPASDPAPTKLNAIDQLARVKDKLSLIMNEAMVIVEGISKRPTAKEAYIKLEREFEEKWAASRACGQSN